MDNQTDMLELINVIINIIDTLIILLPAIVLYLYHKLHIVDIYILEKSESGIIIGIHNITSKTLFFSDCDLIFNRKTQYIQKINLNELNNEKFISVKSDCVYKIEVDYKLMNIEKFKNFRIELTRKNRKIKRKLM